MKTKTILSIAVIMALPFAAHADPVGPAAVPANGTPVVATASAPYVTQTPTAADATHIASTAYVKGAYNDAIAAVNKVANTVDGKQAQLVNDGNNNAMYNKVLNGGTGIGEVLINGDNSEYAGMREDIAMQLSNGASRNPDETLISTGATLQIVRDAGQELKQEIMDETQDDLGLTDMMTAGELVQRAISYTVDNDNTAISNTSDKAVSAEGVIATIVEYNDYLQQVVLPDKQNQLTTTVNNASQNISATVAQTVNTTTPSATTLVSEAAIANAMNNYATTTALNNKRVEIYTTWDNDNAKTEVAFVNATPAQSGQ